MDPDLFRSISAPRATAQGCQVLPTYRSKSTQNVLEAAQIKRIFHLGQRFESNNNWGNICCCCFSSEMHCVCVCVCMCANTLFYVEMRRNPVFTKTYTVNVCFWLLGWQINGFLTRWYFSVTGFGRKVRAFWEGVPGVSFRAGVLVVVVFRWSCACLSDCGIQ